VLRDGRPPHAKQPAPEEIAEGAAETALLPDEQIMLQADEQMLEDGGLSSASRGDLRK
jgi:hypothetical protein